MTWDLKPRLPLSFQLPSYYLQENERRDEIRKQENGSRNQAWLYAKLPAVRAGVAAGSEAIKAPSRKE
jgi:hypothetical protein